MIFKVLFAYFFAFLWNDLEFCLEHIYIFFAKFPGREMYFPKLDVGSLTAIKTGFREELSHYSLGKLFTGPKAYL